MKKCCLFIIVSLLFSFAQAAGNTVVLGGPAILKKIKNQQSELEKASGLKLELREQSAEIGFISLAKGQVKLLGSSVKMDELVNLEAAKDVKAGKVDDYHAVQFSENNVNILLSPSNPATSLSKEQIVDILNGKIKTWETINGKKDPIKPFFLKTQPAVAKAVPQHYIGKNEIPNSVQVTTVEGVIKYLENNPGAISFSGSKYDDRPGKVKIIPIELKLPYFLIAKKPLSPELEKLFAALQKQ